MEEYQLFRKVLPHREAIAFHNYYAFFRALNQDRQNVEIEDVLLGAPVRYYCLYGFTPISGTPLGMTHWSSDAKRPTTLQ